MIAHVPEQGGAAQIPPDTGRTRRGNDPTGRVEHSQPTIDSVVLLHPVEVVRHGGAVAPLEHPRARHHRDVTVPFEQQPVEHVRNVGGGQRQALARGGHQAVLDIVEGDGPDDEDHQGHQEDQDGQVSVGTAGQIRLHGWPPPRPPRGADALLELGVFAEDVLEFREVTLDRKRNHLGVRGENHHRIRVGILFRGAG